MSGSGFAYLPWYVRDWWSDPKVRSLHWIQRAIYRDMLDLSWETGPLPDDPHAISRGIGWDGRHAFQFGDKDPRDPDYIFPIDEWIRAVLDGFWSREDGGWTNPRLERERQRSLALVAKSSSGGNARAKAMTAEERAESAKKAAQARWGRESVPECVPDACPMPTSQAQEQAQESSPPTEGAQPPAAPSNGQPKKTRKPPTGPAAELVKAFCEEDWPFYRKDVGPYVPQGRDFIAAARLLKVHPVKEIRRRAQNMLMRDTDFWRENASLFFLETRWNGLALEPGGE